MSLKNIIPISDLQRQAATIVAEVNRSPEPVIVTQRGRPAAVILSAERYAEIEEYLAWMDDVELLPLIDAAEEAIANGETISHEEVKKRLNFRG